MPLYMDIHLLKDVSVEDAREAHIKDLAVQEKYGVTYHQYWFNEKAGTIYCLMEGPDKESCEATHREANGIIACQIVEVKGGIYDLFMGKNHKLDHGLVRHEDGKIDTGYRYILTLDITAKTINSVSIDFDQLKLPLNCLAMENLKPYSHLDLSRYLLLFSPIKQVFKELRQEKCKAFYPCILCGIFLFFAITDSFCQGTIQGNVKDEKGHTIAFTNILLLDKN
ncbi:hypothetical protein BH23BAC1_BH23BAC1_04200 [soil metagenome]